MALKSLDKRAIKNEMFLLLRILLIELTVRSRFEKNE